MVTVPAAFPRTKPAELTDAIAGLLLLHTPPAAASLNVVVAPPAHTDAAPVIGPTTGNRESTEKAMVS